MFQDKYTFPFQIIPLTKIKEDTEKETKICENLFQDKYTFHYGSYLCENYRRHSQRNEDLTEPIAGQIHLSFADHHFGKIKEGTDRETKICQNRNEDLPEPVPGKIHLSIADYTFLKIREDIDRETKISQNLLQDTYTFPLQIIPLAKFRKTLTEKRRFARTCCRTNTPFHCRSYLCQNEGRH